jgi:molybdopterin/thiamine biosynthesis adenylyltransferase
MEYFTSEIEQNLSMSSDLDKYDRQNRTYGKDGTQKLQKATVIIKGPLADITYEVCKNLVLSGVSHLRLDITSNDEVITSKPFQLGHIHLTSIDVFIDQIVKLNPNVHIKKINICQYQFVCRC